MSEFGNCTDLLLYFTIDQIRNNHKTQLVF